MKGVILVPTLNRPKILSNFIKSYVETEASVEVLLLIDAEDMKTNLDAYNAISLPHGFTMRVTKGVSMGDKVREIWPEIQDYSWVGLLNDDHYLSTKGWDTKVGALINGHNMVSTNDDNWNFGARIVGLTAWSMPLLKALNLPIFPRNLQHLFIDDFWKAVGESTGCWIETNKINVEHRHAFKGQMEQDETFKKVYSQESFNYDQKEFQHVMEQDFKNICLKVMDAQKNMPTQLR